ncbi:hypothetical protein DM02DRAFT_634207 [Periconia macrospinosa]|uniref:C2H2-type domain-containing protein n=1 Tax=Periconia macrospinosa TaxID=97972 RepID=A0A2V1D9H0_9PLEO|nr:hypothetical protein DM02DRAFT_634207 [Periconia macrospinosa]
MHPEFACNLLEALSLPPWREKLDWGLHITSKWEKRILFSSYVRPITSTSTTNSYEGRAASFPHFGKLSAELQLHILGVCSASTLFQLMRVSSALRTEASKLFWANPNAYFVVDAWWLLDGGYPGYQCCDLAFLQNVQNVEIAYEPYLNRDIWPEKNGERAVRQDLITTFWNSIKRRFPRVKRVSINHSGEPRIGGGFDTVPPPLQALVQACPCTIEISVLILERQHFPSADTSTEIQPRETWQKSQYRLTGGHVWERADSRHSETILLPMRQFRGLVGRFETLKHRSWRIQLQQQGLWPLAIEALDRHHFDQGRNEPFACPWPECDAYFDKGGAWTKHAVVSHYQHAGPFSILPDEIRALFEERAILLEERRGQAKTQFSRMRDEWNNAGQEERIAMERVWTEQLESNNLGDVTGGKASNNKIWECFLEWANGSYY